MIAGIDCECINRGLFANHDPKCPVYRELSATTKKVTHITGRRWFGHTYGNTYHTTTLFHADGTTRKSAHTYGYGDHYLQTAFEMMDLPYGGTVELREKLGITWDVVDVARRKDL